MAEAFSLLGELKSAQGFFHAALMARRRALHLHEIASGPDSLAFARALLAVAAVLEDDLGDLDAAWPLYARSLALHETLLPADHLDLAKAQSALGGLFRVLGRLGEAAPLLERSLATTRAALPPRHPKVARSAANFAALLQDRGDAAAALPLFEEALAIEEVVYGPEHVEVASTLENLAGALEDFLEGAKNSTAATAEAAARAEGLRRRSLRIYELRLPASHAQLATSVSNLGLLLSRAPSSAARGEAPALVRRAWDIQEAAEPGGLLALNYKGNLGLVMVRAGAVEADHTAGWAFIREALAALKAAPHNLPAGDPWCVKFQAELVSCSSEEKEGHL
jgi:tetratricopeptide (TPR) repeat protein